MQTYLHSRLCFTRMTRISVFLFFISWINALCVEGPLECRGKSPGVSNEAIHVLPALLLLAGREEGSTLSLCVWRRASLMPSTAQFNTFNKLYIHKEFVVLTVFKLVLLLCLVKNTLWLNQTIASYKLFEKQ